MDPSRVFLTANQPHVPWSHLVILPPEKVKFLSLKDPESGSIVSWRATKSICSRQESLVSMSWRSKWPVFGQGISFRCMVQICQSAIGFHPNPTHPVRLTGRGGAASYWQGATLRLAVAAQWDVMTPRTVLNNPWRHALRKSSRRFKTGRLLSPLLCLRCIPKL